MKKHTIITYIHHDQISSSMINNSYDLISKNEIVKINRIKNNKQQSLSLIGRACLRLIAQNHFNIQSNIDIDENEYGKPYIKNHNLFFNISHSENILIIAVSNYGEIGIDIEYIKPYNHNIIEFVCSYKEKELLKLNNYSEKIFTKIWTLKESYLKLIGTGLSNDLTQLCIANNSYTFEKILNNTLYSFKSLYKKNYSISICLENKNKIHLLTNKQMLTLLK